MYRRTSVNNHVLLIKKVALVGGATIYIYIYIYMYRERESEREIDRGRYR